MEMAIINCMRLILEDSVYKLSKSNEPHPLQTLYNYYHDSMLGQNYFGNNYTQLYIVAMYLFHWAIRPFSQNNTSRNHTCQHKLLKVVAGSIRLSMEGHDWR